VRPSKATRLFLALGAALRQWRTAKRYQTANSVAAGHYKAQARMWLAEWCLEASRGR
jgi:hypothetical protein